MPPRALTSEHSWGSDAGVARSNSGDLIPVPLPLLPPRAELVDSMYEDGPHGHSDSDEDRDRGGGDNDGDGDGDGGAADRLPQRTERSVEEAGGSDAVGETMGGDNEGGGGSGGGNGDGNDGSDGAPNTRASKKARTKV